MSSSRATHHEIPIPFYPITQLFKKIGIAVGISLLLLFAFRVVVVVFHAKLKIPGLRIE